MDAIKEKDPLAAGILVGIAEANGMQGIAIRMPNGESAVFAPEYIEIVITQMDMLLSELAIDEDDLPDPESGPAPVSLH